MSKFKKKLIRQIIADILLSNLMDIQNYLKDMFKDVIRKMLGEEFELELDYEKGDSLSKNIDDIRNVISKKC